MSPDWIKPATLTSPDYALTRIIIAFTLNRVLVVLNEIWDVSNTKCLFNNWDTYNLVWVIIKGQSCCSHFLEQVYNGDPHFSWLLQPLFEAGVTVLVLERACKGHLVHSACIQCLWPNYTSHDRNTTEVVAQASCLPCPVRLTLSTFPAATAFSGPFLVYVIMTASIWPSCLPALFLSNPDCHFCLCHS